LEKSEVLSKLNYIFKNVFDDEKIEIELKSNADSVSGWDSLNHIYLITEIEEKFNLKFTSEEIQKWNEVSNIVDSILNRQ